MAGPGAELGLAMLGHPRMPVSPLVVEGKQAEPSEGVGPGGLLGSQEGLPRGCRLSCALNEGSVQ